MVLVPAIPVIARVLSSEEPVDNMRSPGNKLD